MIASGIEEWGYQKKGSVREKSRDSSTEMLVQTRL
jgi:hypothetical protein